MDSGTPAGGAPPEFGAMEPRRLLERCDIELRRRRELLARMEREAGPEGVLAQFNELSLMTAGFDDPLGVLQNAAPDAATRDAAQDCLEQLIPFATELFQSARLYARVAALRPEDPQDGAYRDWLIEQFEDAGATLPEDARGRAKELQDELAALSLRFQRNVNDCAATVTLAPREVEGLSEDWRRARARDAQGNYLVGMEYPCYVPFMEAAVDEDARRRVWTQFQNRAAPGNLALFDRALALRAEFAAIHGEADYASFSLRRKMAGTPAAVAAFLESVRAAVDEIEAAELEELRRDKELLACGAARVRRWDVAYLQQRIRRRRFDVDPEALRASLPTVACVRFVMRTAERLYGIRFEAGAAPAWHESVRYYAVVEDGTAGAGAAGTPLGGIYLDLYPRAGKFSHAAVFGVRRGSTLARQDPIKALICNLNEQGLTPAELETLFHEFGHALHGVLSRARYADQSGTAVRQDFVEVPSMMFEEWARREDSLRGFAQVSPDSPPLAPAIVAQIAAARRFGAGLRYARQWLYASFDLALHRGAPGHAQAAWEQLEGATRLGHEEGTMMPASFSHLMGGYEAGYYGYLWAEVLATDMLSAFGADLLDPAVGRRYRHIVLEAGGSRPPQALVEEFLGRRTDTAAFFAQLREPQ